MAGFDLVVTPTVTAGAYTAGDIMGALLTFKVGVRNTVIVNEATVMIKAAVTPTLNLVLLEGNPSNTTTTDNAAYSLNAADAFKVRKTIPVTTLYDHGTPNEYSSGGINLVVVPGGGADVTAPYYVDEMRITYTAVGNVEDVGEHGGTAQVTEFTPVDTGIVQKIKGSINYGALNLMIGQVSSDAGQDIIDAAFASKNRYSVKIAYPVRTGESTGEIHYLDVLVTKRVWQDGAANNVRKLATTFEVCRAPVVVAGT